MRTVTHSLMDRDISEPWKDPHKRALRELWLRGPWEDWDWERGKNSWEDRDNIEEAGYRRDNVAFALPRAFKTRHTIEDSITHCEDSEIKLANW